MRMKACIACMTALVAPTMAEAQSFVAEGGEAVRFEDSLARLSGPAAFTTTSDAPFGASVEFIENPAVASLVSSEPTSLAQRDTWFAGDGFQDRLRLTTASPLRRADGAPVPPRALDAMGRETEAYDVTYTRGWAAARGRTASGLEVSLTPHAGVGFGSEGGSAEAGATLRIGSGVERMVPEGQDAFGQKARWYVYAAGSKRAVGYNFARTRDGDFARSGMTHDAGSFLGDASIGVAWRRGPIQSSFGLVYREIESKGLRGTEGFRNDVDEGLVAFQFSIRP